MPDQKLFYKNKLRLSLTPVQLIVLGYLFFAVAGTLLLSLPFSIQPGVDLSFIDALFTATSAISVTGLTVVSTPETFSLAGKVILVFLLHFGGIGIMTLGTLVFIIRGNQVNLRNRMMIMADQNQTSMQGMVKLMLFIFKVAIIIELLGALFFAAYMWAYYAVPVRDAVGLGIFHSVSGFTNGGFDLFGNSLMDFSHDYFLQGLLSVLLVAGAIGFPVLLEIYSYSKALRNRQRFRFSLYTRLTTITFGILAIAGFLFTFLFEMPGVLAELSWHQKISVAFFNSLNTRSGGFSSVDVAAFRDVTLIFFCFLMFVGGSPTSCGGGIRTTTFAVVFLSMLASLRGQNNVKVFRRELYEKDVMRAFTVLFIGLLLVFASTLILLQYEPISITEALFEVCSAFGTTGLSIGIAGDLSIMGKSVLIVLMFVGRVGIISLILMFQKRRTDEGFHFVKERINIG
ncbi:MAG: TrkH family potassium uptake protein [Bacillota bacterium]